MARSSLAEKDILKPSEAINEDRNAPKVQKSIDGYSGILFYDDNGMPLVVMHWQHHFNHMVVRCQTLHLMYADTRIVRIWKNRE